MDTDLDRLYRQALKLVSMADAARGMERPYRTLQDRKAGRRGVTPEAARDLAVFLRGRSTALAAAAAALEDAAARLEPEEGR